MSDVRADTDFSGRNILVIGGSSGIGNGIAQAFRKRGGQVHVWGTRACAVDYRGETGSDLTGLAYAAVDVTDRCAIDDYRPPFGHLDILILCQGIALYRRREFEREGWDRVMAVNLDSVMDCAMKFRDMLGRSRGSLNIVSSIGGMHATRSNPAYCASKAGTISLVRTLAQAWAGDGVRVNGIAPGPVETKLSGATLDDPDRRASLLQRIPLGRIGTPDDIAGAALFLASPMASYITGQTLVVDGGTILT